MPSPVSIVTIHHEGGGAPTDEPRGSDDGGYTYWIGTSRWTWLRTVWDSWATIHHNGISLDLCLSGNRMDHPVSDVELDIIRGACADGRARGYVISSPEVHPHKDFYNTACPGTHTLNRWAEVVAAVLAGTSGAPVPEPVPPKPVEEHNVTIIIYKGTPHSFWIDEHGWLQHSWGQGTRENMADHAPGEHYNAGFPVGAAVNGDWLNVRAVCNDHPDAGRRLMCFDHHPGRKPAWSAYTVHPLASASVAAASVEPDDGSTFSERVANALERDKGKG